MATSNGSNDATRPPLSEILPPLILGTATFNHQYVSDPTSMPYTSIVTRALAHGIFAFDTSPYYGPSEILLGRALASIPDLKRDSYLIITKAGRKGPRAFDYSPAWIRHSVARSCRRLHTPYLDLVYLHDVEFVSPEEVLGAIRTLRELRAEGTVRYVGISGFTLGVLTSLARRAREETGEPLDAVMSYCHCTVQNTTLAGKEVLGAFREAGVGVVLNASVLGMGMLTTRGVDDGPQAAWHPSPAGLRKALREVEQMCRGEQTRIEAVSMRYAFDVWARAGEDAGFGVKAKFIYGGGEVVVGPTVIGVSSVDELDETVKVWNGERGVLQMMANKDQTEYDQARSFVEKQLWPALGEWKDYEWSSPEDGYVNEVKPEDMGNINTSDHE